MLAEASFHARVVLGLLTEAIIMGEIENVRSQLPAEFHQLFDVKNEGELPGTNDDGPRHLAHSIQPRRTPWEVKGSGNN